MEKTYTIVKEQTNGEKIYIDYSKFNGYKVKPRNNVKYAGVKVNSLVIMKPSFIEKILKKKVKRKLDFYLQYHSFPSGERQAYWGMRIEWETILFVSKQVLGFGFCLCFQLQMLECFLWDTHLHIHLAVVEVQDYQ